MFSTYPVAEVAALLSEPPRVAIITALLDGSARPAGELARCAGLSAPAASAHLSRLTTGGLLVVVASGRHRYYRIARSEVATAVEALAAASPRAQRSRPDREDAEGLALRRLRTCYDHLAGELAVEMTQGLVARGALRLVGKDFSITRTGRSALAALGIDVSAIEREKRILARACLDWTERKPHVAGALGAALLTQCRHRRWVAARKGTRALRVTAEGERELLRWVQAS